MTINKPGSHAEHYICMGLEEEYSHYYISSTNFRSILKNQYLCYINCIKNDSNYDIDYIEYWTLKRI